MITKIEIQDPSKTPVSHFSMARGLEKLRTLELRPRINVLLGPNGCGKSTLLQLLAHTFMCAEGQVPTVTYDALKKFSTPMGYIVHHDGSPVGFADPSHDVGLDTGHFVDDFFLAGVQSVFAKKSSSGQQTDYKLWTLFSKLLKEGVETDWRVPKKWDKDHPMAAKIQNWMAAQEITHSEDPHSRVLLLDEPDRSLDLFHQAKLWDLLFRVNERVQIIVSTHSIYPLLRLPREQIIDLVPGYLDACLGAHKALVEGTELPKWDWSPQAPEVPDVESRKSKSKSKTPAKPAKPKKRTKK